MATGGCSWRFNSLSVHLTLFIFSEGCMCLCVSACVCVCVFSVSSGVCHVILIPLIHDYEGKSGTHAWYTDKQCMLTGNPKASNNAKKKSYLWTGYITFYRNVDTISKDLEDTVWTPFDWFNQGVTFMSATENSKVYITGIFHRSHLSLKKKQKQLHLQIQKIFWYHK